LNADPDEQPYTPPVHGRARDRSAREPLPRTNIVVAVGQPQSGETATKKA